MDVWTLSLSVQVDIEFEHKKINTISPYLIFFLWGRRGESKWCFKFTPQNHFLQNDIFPQIPDFLFFIGIARVLEL